MSASQQFFVKLKNLAKSALRSKNFPWFCFVLIIFGLLPLYFAKAGLRDTLLWLPSQFFTLAFGALLYATEGFLRFTNFLLGWAIGNPFTVSATNPATNPVINMGWTLTRDITNILFILGLAYIGLATALNLSTLEAKKAFPQLLITALLVNFSPVLVGIVFDFVNIVASYFLQGIDFSVLGDIFSMQRTVLWQHKGELLTNGSVLMQVIMLIGFGFISCVVLLIFAGLFLVRIPIMWIVVILSPLALFFRIFSQTKKYYDTWKNLFVQWSMIAIPAGFFIYLAQYAVASAQDVLKEISAGNPGGGFFAAVAPYMVAILFLIYGLITALKINAMGSGMIMKQAKKGVDKAKTTFQPKKIASAGKKITGHAITTAAGVTAGGIGGMIAGAKASKGTPWYRRALATGGGGLKGAGRQGFTRAGREEIRAWRDRRIEAIPFVKPGYTEQQKAKRLTSRKKEDLKKRYARMSDEKVQQQLERGGVMGKDKAILLEILAERNKFEFKDASGNIDTAKEKKMIDLAERFNADLSNVTKSRPDLTPLINATKAEKELIANVQKEIDFLSKSLGLSQKDAKERYYSNRDTQIGTDATTLRVANPALSAQEAQRQARINLESKERKQIEDTMIIKAVEGMQAGEFRQNVRASALRNSAVIAGMDQQKRENLGKNGSREQRRAVHSTAGSVSHQNLRISMLNEVVDLQHKETALRGVTGAGAAAASAEADRVKDMWQELEDRRIRARDVSRDILTDVNFIS